MHRTVKIIIAGPLRLDPSGKLAEQIESWITSVIYDTMEVRAEDVVILSGGAGEMDQFGEYLAKEHGWSVIRFPADWKRLGKKAGYVRNVQMAQVADALIAIWDRQSKGVWHMILTAVERGLQVYVRPLKRVTRRSRNGRDLRYARGARSRFVKERNE